MVKKEITPETLFRESFITTRSGLLSAIEARTIRMETQFANAPSVEASSYQARASLMRLFSDTVHRTPLFENLDMGWSYSVSIGSRGATLHLNHWEHVAVIKLDDDVTDLDVGDCDASFDLLKTEAHLLSSEEFAERCGVSGNTIRMWVRRGKIRSAVKIGNTWKIPEATEPFSRGFKDASYEWHSNLNDIPGEFTYLSDAYGLHIRRMRSQEKPFTITLTDQFGIPIDERFLNVADAEKLEAYLISTPSITYTGDLEYINKLEEEVQ